MVALLQAFKMSKISLKPMVTIAPIKILALEFDDHLRYVIEEYQKFYNINVFGMLDSDTIKQMMMPRCGVANIIHEKKNSKKFHNHSSTFVSKFSYYGRKWPPSITNLIYTIKTRPPNIDTKTLVSVIANSFLKWAKVSRFTFQYVRSGLPENIVIGFYSGDHGDGTPFDGRGNIVAHAFSSPNEDFIFDNDEYWSIRPNSGEMDLESVSVHEIGHILELGHSNDRNSIMYPILNPGHIKRHLSTDDIVGIPTLYSN
ncbi:hypothetical protein ACFE04_026506 [Oxalis oulophora]